MKEATIIPVLKFQNGALPFKVETLKNFIENQDDIQEGPHSHNYFEMVWLTKGRATLSVDMQEYTIGTNMIFCARPNQTHQFKMEEDMEGFIFSFTDSFFKMDEYEFDRAGQAAFLQLFSGNRTIRITHEMEEDMKDIVVKMIKEFDNQYAHRTDLLKRYFKIFLICLTRLDEEIQSSEQSREAELVKNFMELLDKHFREKKMVAEYAVCN